MGLKAIHGGAFAGDQLRRLHLADPRQRPEGGFQVSGGPSRGEPVPIRAYRRQKGVQRLQPVTDTKTNRHGDEICSGQP